MKTKAPLRNFLLAAGSSLLAISSAHAATYTWNLRGTGSQDWETLSNWASSTKFASSSSNELAFSIDAKTGGNITGTQTITNVPTALSMNTLTLGGVGPNSVLGLAVIIGDNTSTWTIGDGATSTVNLTSTLGGGTSDRELRYTIGANLVLAGGTSGITTFTGNSTSGTGAVFSGNITETALGKGITKSGSSLLIFSGNNSYTGTTTVSAGTLRLNSATALSGGLGATGGTSALTISGNTGVVELGAGNFQRNLGTGSNQFQMTAGGTNTSGFSAFGGPRVITVNNDASQELVWGSASFNPGKLLLNAATANNSLELSNRIDLSTATRTVVVNANKALLSGVIRTASGTAGLTKEGNGTLVLNGANTYNGTTTITGGTLSIGAANNLGTATSLVLNGTATDAGGTIQIRGTALTSFTGLASSVAVTATRAVGFDIQDVANTFTVNQVLNQTTGNFTKSGAGTLVLNQNNTFTGATTITGGGTLVLDYTTNTGSKLADAALLTLNGSNLVLKNGSSLTETVGSTTLINFSGNTISRDGGNTKISLGTLTTDTLSNLAISGTGIATTTASTTVASGILTLGRVTVGSDFAALDGSYNIVPYSGYTPYTAGGGGGSLTVTNQLAGGGTMTGTLSSYSLRIVNSGNSDVLTLNSGADLRVSNGGTILYAGGSDNNYTINGGGFLGSNSGSQPLNVNVFTGTLTVNAALATGGTSLAKSGAGTLVAGGTNTYTGATYIQQGVLRATSVAALGTVAGGTIVQGGAALELSNNITVGAEALSINGTGISNGGALRNHSGSNTYGGLITIGASGARINSNVSTTLTLTGGIATTLTQDVTFGGLGNTTVSTTAISGSGNLIKDGAGTVTLSAANTYTGPTTVSAGTLRINGSTAAGSAVSVAAGTSSGVPVAQLGGTGTIGGTVALATESAATYKNGGVLAPTAAASGTALDVTGTTTFTTGSIFEWNMAATTPATDPGVVSNSGSYGQLAGTGAITGSNAVFKIALGAGNAFTDNFWNSDKSWTNVFTGTGATNTLASMFTSFGGTGVSATGEVTGKGSFSFTGTSTLNWTYSAIPEPTSALAGLLLGAGLLRRRRTA
jgi:fibronectin-binding autotransporter adhesin